MRRRKAKAHPKLLTQLEAIASVRKPLPRPSLVLVNRKARAKRRRLKRVDPSADHLSS